MLVAGQAKQHLQSAEQAAHAALVAHVAVDTGKADVGQRRYTLDAENYHSGLPLPRPAEDMVVVVGHASVADHNQAPEYDQAAVADDVCRCLDVHTDHPLAEERTEPLACLPEPHRLGRHFE